MSIIKLNFENIENLVFQDTNLKSQLPQYKRVFDQWHLAVMTGLRSIRQKSLLDFLDKFNLQHLPILENYFKSLVSIDKSLYYRTIRLAEFPLNEAEKKLNEQNLGEYFSICRDAEQLYICFWR